MKDTSRELITIWESQSVSTGECKDNFPHFVTNPFPVIHQQITTSGCIWLCTLISSSWTTSLPGRECVNGVSGPAWFRSGHAGVRWAIDPSQQAFPPGDSSACTASSPPPPPQRHWLSAMAFRCHGRTWHLMILWWSNVTFITCRQKWRGRIWEASTGQSKTKTNQTR